MTEAGGPATQAGIFYQNGVAALYLGRMLDLRPRPARDRVVHVRVEAPEAVDDTVVRMADGARRFLQAKLALAPRGAAWIGLWRNFAAQLAKPDFAADDTLALVVGEHTAAIGDLRACCERALSAADEAEWLGRLTAAQRRIALSIAAALAVGGSGLPLVRRLLARTEVEVVPDATIERDQAPLWMPDSPVARPARLLAILRDMIGGKARVRGSFEPGRLRERLRDEHGIHLDEPAGWGAAQYREVIAERTRVEVPGTAVAGRVNELFVWPRARRHDRARPADFDDESPPWFVGVRSDQVDLSLFPSPGLDRVVVVAGPGFGKSVLLLALAERLAARGLLPAIIPIPELSKLDSGIHEYLGDRLNKTFEVAIDWRMATEKGLLVLLLDGLDEVSSDRRAVVLDRVKTFSSRHRPVPWLLTVRDAAALAAPTDALLVELDPLDDRSVARFVERYRPDRPDLASALLRRIEAKPDLHRLVRIPLFLVILLATVSNPDEVPTKRAALLETYLDLLFRPEQFKGGEPDGVDPAALRPITEAVAFSALEREEIGVDQRALDATIRSHAPPGAPVQPVVERLVKCGVLRRTGPGRFAFPFPIVQEYLAACHLLANRLEEVPGRLPSAVKRPWAQALQFVLEQHPTPGALVDDLLAREDDAFHTNLRLVARCVANGATVEQGTRVEIARRLARMWPRASWRARARRGTHSGGLQRPAGGGGPGAALEPAPPS